MGATSPDQLCRIIQPLVDVGLEPEQIRGLLFRLAFDGIVGGSSATVTGVTSVVHDQPVEVQAAWLHTVGRMLSPDTAAPAFGRGRQRRAS